jgi:hypothetical protein
MNPMPDLSSDENLSKYAETCPEVVLYFLIDQMGGMAWRLRHDAYRDGGRGYLTKEQADGMIAEATKISKRVQSIVPQVKRFGVDPVLAKKNNPILEIEVEAPSPQYWAWFRWWDEYVKGLSDEKFRELDVAMIAESDLSSWRPEGDWRARIEQPPTEQPLSATSTDDVT